ncbi:hypothetical protein EVAR_100908_1 [Eumeta japonica]|uniref:Uncharacterized protein n=1 Tax=Eumeta variegata TaxID=151549 RepID=A0A4C1T1Q1_EUMVA|nr:hypothetical protein EVAR_100908_1 [Eumeta japonica]
MGLRRLITESGHLLAPSSDADYHIVSKSTRQDESNEPKLDGVASFNYGVPMATFQLHHQTLITIEFAGGRRKMNSLYVAPLQNKDADRPGPY